MLDAYAQAGGNFIDTADIYGRRGHGIGRLRANHRPLDRRARQSRAARDRHEGRDVARAPGLSAPRPIARGAEDSLRAPRHRAASTSTTPTRTTSPTPLEETLGAFQRADRRPARSATRRPPTTTPSGSARRSSWASSEGLARYVALQPHYNLMERDYEGELRAALRAPRARLRALLRARARLSDRQVPPRRRRGRQPARGGRARELPQRARLRACSPRSTRSPRRASSAVAAVALAWLRGAADGRSRRSPARSTPAQLRRAAWPASSSSSRAEQLERLSAAAA